GWRRVAGRGTLVPSFVWADKGGDPLHGPVVKLREGVSRFPSGNLIGTKLEPIDVCAHADFATVLTSCTSVPRTACSEFSVLFLLGVAMAFGFSERLVARFEDDPLSGDPQ